MKKITLILSVLMMAALACSTVKIADTAPTDIPADPPNAVATLLADPAFQAEDPPDQPTETPEPTTEKATSPEEVAQTPESVSTFTPTPEVTATYSGFPTAIPLPNPMATGFTTCLNDCLSDGSNHQSSFPVKTEIIYFRFEFDEFPVSAPYSRIWTKDGVEWVRYSCYWPGPESGVEEITLTDPLGLPSGTWNVVISVNGVEVINETLEIEGSWNQWSPPGYFNSCYGKR